jgi:GT2 family glycosyltransferase
VDLIPGLGVLGPATNTESGQALGGFGYDTLGELFARNDALAREQGGAWERARKISGLCMVLPRAALEKLGPLDTEFGLGYFEDDDLCLRAEDLGLTVAWAKDLHVHHFGSVSFGPRAKARLERLEEGMARFAFKWGKRGLDHITQQHRETLLRPRRPRSLSC